MPRTSVIRGISSVSMLTRNSCSSPASTLTSVSESASRSSTRWSVSEIRLGSISSWAATTLMILAVSSSMVCTGDPP
jgi:hypothetical protein